jgi:aryl-alcohol dehydrogenase-like predicted oxidoreductase
MDALRDLQSRAKIAGWGTSVVSADAVENPNARRVLEEASFVSLPYHLLDTSVYDRVARSLVGGDAKVLVHNPYADGRLDGSFFRTNPFHVRNPPRPADWLEMQRWWEPITRLAFLTEGKKRSLAQAAIQFALSPPSVSSVILSEAEILSVRGSPTGIAGSPLSMEELGRIRSLLSRTPDPSPAVRPLDAHREA